MQLQQENEIVKLEGIKVASKCRAKMPRSQRAKQFAPFDALVGLRQALKEKEKIWHRKPRRLLFAQIVDMKA